MCGPPSSYLHLRWLIKLAVVSVFAQRGHWFPNEGDIEGFRANLRRACPRDESVVRLLAAHVLAGAFKSISLTALKPMDHILVNARISQQLFSYTSLITDSWLLSVLAAENHSQAEDLQDGPLPAGPVAQAGGPGQRGGAAARGARG
jgi:hypothetical protein